MNSNVLTPEYPNGLEFIFSVLDGGKDSKVDGYCNLIFCIDAKFPDPLIVIFEVQYSRMILVERLKR